MSAKESEECNKCCGTRKIRVPSGSIYGGADIYPCPMCKPWFVGRVSDVCTFANETEVIIGVAASLGAAHAIVDAYNAQSAELASLRERLAAAEKDADRLDYMIQSGDHFGHARDGENCWLMYMDDDGDVHQRGAFDSGREAIDAALTAERAKEGETQK